MKHVSTMSPETSNRSRNQHCSWGRGSSESGGGGSQWVSSVWRRIGREPSWVDQCRTLAPCLSHFLPGGWRDPTKLCSCPSCHLCFLWSMTQNLPLLISSKCSCFLQVDQLAGDWGWREFGPVDSTLQILGGGVEWGGCLAGPESPLVKNSPEEMMCFVPST